MSSQKIWNSEAEIYIDVYTYVHMTYHMMCYMCLYIYVIYNIHKHNQKNEGGRLMSFMKISAFRKITGEKVMTISSISSVGKLGSYM